MIPLILASKSDKKTKNFLKGYIAENKFSPDRIVEVSPLKNEIVISQIREIRKRIAISSTLARLFIFHNFDKATLEAQNAFLKTLEEGGLKNQFILIVNNEHLLLNTVRSRSTIIKLKGNITTEDKTQERRFNLLKRIETTTNFEFLTEATLTNPTREEIANLIEELIIFYRNKLAVETKAVKIIKKALHLKSLLENNNLSPQFTYDNLLIFISKAFRMKI